MDERTTGGDIIHRVTQTDKSIDDLLHQAEYTPAELASLLDVPLTLVEHDAFAGKLKALIIEHDIITILRDDAIAWLRGRE